MRPRTLLILFALVAGLASFIWFIEGDLPGTAEQAERALRLLSFNREEVSQLTLERHGERVVLERSTEGEWRLLEPVAARADPDAVESLLTELEGLEKERTFADGEAEALGLAPPRAVVSLVGSEGDLRFFVGSDVPASESMIAATDPAGPFHVVARAAWTAMDRTAESWRERTVFPGQRNEIERIVFVRGDERVSLASRGDGFVLEEPLVDRVDEGTISRFLDALVGLEVSEFIDAGESAAEGFDSATDRRTLEVHTRGDDMAWRLELGGTVSAEGVDEPEGEAEEEAVDQAEDQAESRFVRADGHVYVVPDSFGGAFDRSAGQWRSLEWSGHQVHEIDRLEVRDAVGTMTLEGLAGDWQRDGVRVEYGVVSDLLYAFAGTKADALDAGEAIAGPPILSATVNSGDGEQVLEIFAPSGDSYPATVSDREPALWLSGDRVRSIVSKVAAVRSAPPLPDEAVDDQDTAAEPTASTAAAGPD